MLSGRKLGSNSRIRRIQTPSTPTLDGITEYVRELMASPHGARFDINWLVEDQSYTLTVSFNHEEAISDWKLYTGREPKSQLLWEHQTNDVPLLYNLVSSAAGQSEKNISDVDMTMNTRGGHHSTTESRSGAYMISNLQKLVTEAQHDPGRIPLNPGFQETSPAPYQKPYQASYQAPRSTINESSARLVEQAFGDPSAAETQPDVSPQAAHTVDLTPGRRLLQTLLFNELGIISYPAFQFLLEHEYYKSLAANSPMSIVLMNIIGVTQEDGSVYQGPLPRTSVQNLLHFIRKKLRKTDVLAEYEHRSFAFLLPETEEAGAKLFTRKVERLACTPDILPGPGNTGLKLAFGIAPLSDKLRTLPVLLAGAEQALRAAQVNDKLLMTYEDYNESLSTPWESEKQSAVPVVQKGVDLGPMRSLLATLKTADPGVFSNAAWLMFLEREYHRSQRQRRALLTMLLRLRRFEINSNHPEHLVPQAALHEALRRLEKLQSKGDILGQFGEGDYALLRPNASLKSLENLSRQIKNSLLELPLSDEFDHQYLRVGVQINAVFGHTSLPEMLMLHPILS